MSAFLQYIFTGSAWSGPQGKLAIIPKDEGKGIMISAFQSREFGFGMNLSQIEIQKINQYHSEKRLLYTEAESAMIVNVTTIKKPLENSPFILFFNMATYLARKGTGCMITCAFNLKIVSTQSRHSNQNMLQSGCLITEVDMIEEGKMDYLWAI